MIDLKPGATVRVSGRTYEVVLDPDAPPRIYCGQRDRFILRETAGGGGVDLAAGERVRIGALVYELREDAGVASLRYLFIAGIE